MERPSRATAPPERRGKGRERSYLSGSVVVLNGTSFDCAIRNLGPDGARLKPPAGSDVPDDFHLVIQRDGIAHRCSVIWRTQQEIGVRFGHAVNLRNDHGFEALELRRFWRGA